ncbi:MAG TPA: hypothetical protein DCE43_18660 [Planctomycetaceae bacterium]|nr:hypothetical protein [Planctomycetaceae bacterium]
MSSWDVCHELGDEPSYQGLVTEDLRELYSTRQIGPEEWTRPDAVWPWKQVATWDELADITHAQRRRRDRQGQDDEEMDMTPMIDITFLLLIFFMITAAFDLQKGLVFPPPESDRESQTEAQAPGLAEVQQDRIVLRIGADDSFQLLDANQQPGPVIAPEDLVEELRARSQAETKDQLLILPDELASHEAVVLAVDSTARAGITKVSIADVRDGPGP